MKLSPHKLHMIFFSTSGISEEEFFEHCCIDLKDFDSYQCITAHSLNSTDDFFALYEILSKAFKKNNESDTLFVDIDNFETESYGKVRSYIGMHDILYVEKDNADLVSPQRILSRELLRTPITPSLLYIKQGTLLKKALPDPDLLNFGIWDLLLSLNRDVFRFAYEGKTEYQENILLNYVEFYKKHAHRYVDDLPEATNEWRLLRQTLYSRILYKNMSLYEEHFCSLLPELEHQNQILTQKLRTKRSELKHSQRKYDIAKTRSKNLISNLQQEIDTIRANTLRTKIIKTLRKLFPTRVT